MVNNLMFRRRAMMQNPPAWDYTYVKEYQGQTWMLDVVEGQILTVKWESPESYNANGWVLNGYSCCNSIRQIRNVGENGEQTLTVTASGQVRVGGYASNSTFNLSAGSKIYIKIR